jgi:hypothetical protein
MHGSKEVHLMKRIIFALAAAALVASAPGCFMTEDSPTAPPEIPPIPESGVDLDLPTGGFTTADEAPAFGEPEEYEALARESSIQDPIENTLEYQRQHRARGARVFEFRAMWGKLWNLDDSTGTDACPLDWSGRLHLEGGIIAMKKAIAFEPEDSLYRIDPSTIGWISHTGPHIDGIHVKLVVPPPPPSDSSQISNAVPVLVMRTGPFSRSFTIDELVGLRLIEPVDRCGNGISIVSFLHLPPCPHGQLVGAWKLLPPESIAPSDSNGTVHGHFRGIWIGANGDISGHLRGVFGRNSEGKRVFFGKYIDTSGTFMGVLRGEYGMRPEITAESAQPRGWFAGEWIGRGTAIEGRLKGHWMMNAENGAGCFHGVWGMNCSPNL